ncbi:hypothetical protein [Microcoleus anatoxicus]|uniref:hypothetical protein n=1 Tax=Microcoleus anatoxicus TaxID=2705319 RepID=UPI0030C909C0
MKKLDTLFPRVESGQVQRLTACLLVLNKQIVLKADRPIALIHHKPRCTATVAVLLKLYLSIGPSPQVLCKIVVFCYKTLSSAVRSSQILALRLVEAIAPITDSEYF